MLATVTMDVAMVLAARLAPDAFASDKIGPEVVGRWAAGLCRGRWRHDDISAESPVRGELWIGLAAHYVTGITLTAVFVEAARRSGRRPGLADGTAYGLATAVLPLLLMYPVDGLRLVRAAERRRPPRGGLDAPRARRVRRRHRALGGYQTKGMNRRRTLRR